MYEREKEEKKQIKARGKIYDDMVIITIVIFWQREAKVIGIQKMYGLFGLNHRILEKMCEANRNIIHQIMLKSREDAEGSTFNTIIIFITIILDSEWLSFVQ